MLYINLFQITGETNKPPKYPQTKTTKIIRIMCLSGDKGGMIEIPLLQSI